MRERGRFAGMWTIVRFNWPIYATALAIIPITLVAFVFVGAPLLKVTCIAAVAGAVWFLVGSLAASHIVYDRSDLHRGNWLARALRGTVLRRAAVCHCGYDEISALVREQLPGAEILTFDHFDDVTMSEPSIRRARRLFPPAPGTTPAPFSKWPASDSSLDAVFGALAIHELRTHPERAAWFTEARRCLTPCGRVVLVEHVRDVANFAAFGPGFVHFHTAATWHRAWTSARLRLVEEFRITPFVRVFVLGRHD